jgi:peptidyl-prolyl cis-trans isomerase C
VLAAQGRAADAKAMAQALAKSPVIHKRDRVLLDAFGPGLSQSAVALPTITDEQVRAEYDRSLKQNPTEYKVRHILVQTREQAQLALDRIRGGEPFEAVAKAVSADPGSRERGGDLGWSVPGHYVEPFAEAVKRLAPQGLAEQPVQTRFGWHVIEVTQVRDRVLPPYDQIKERLREVLQRRAAPAS